MRFFPLVAAFALLLVCGQALAQEEIDSSTEAAPPPFVETPTTPSGPPGGPSGGGPFYQGGIQMATMPCPHITLECDTVALKAQEIVNASNECINKYLYIPESIMAEFRTSGEYENCVTPSSISVTAKGTKSWAVCCVKKESSENQCGLYCTRYIGQGGR